MSQSSVKIDPICKNVVQDNRTISTATTVNVMSDIEIENEIGICGLKQKESIANEAKSNQRQSVQKFNSDMLHSDNINEDLMTDILEQEGTANNFIQKTSQGKDTFASNFAAVKKAVVILILTKFQL